MLCQMAQHAEPFGRIMGGSFLALLHGWSNGMVWEVVSQPGQQTFATGWNALTVTRRPDGSHGRGRRHHSVTGEFEHE